LTVSIAISEDDLAVFIAHLCIIASVAIDSFAEVIEVFVLGALVNHALTISSSRNDARVSRIVVTNATVILTHELGSARATSSSGGCSISVFWVAHSFGGFTSGVSIGILRWVTSYVSADSSVASLILGSAIGVIAANRFETNTFGLTVSSGL
jgi:hypothetical protein